MSLLQDLFSDNRRMMDRLGITREEENRVLKRLGVDVGQVLYNETVYEVFIDELICDGFRVPEYDDEEEYGMTLESLPF